MANATPPPGGRKTLTLVLLAIAVLLIIYFAYRCSKSRISPPAVEPTPVVAGATATAVPTQPPAVTPTSVPVAGCVVPDVLPACKDWLVTVGPGADQLYADGQPADWICLGPTNSVRWRPQTGSTGLKIFFPTSGFPSSANKDIPPFLGMHRETTAATDKAAAKDEWVFNNVSLPIFSGRPNAALGSGEKCFKYDQEINGVRMDGRIIIQH